MEQARVRDQNKEGIEQMEKLHEAKQMLLQRELDIAHQASGLY